MPPAWRRRAVAGSALAAAALVLGGCGGNTSPASTNASAATASSTPEPTTWSSGLAMRGHPVVLHTTAVFHNYDCTCIVAVDLETGKTLWQQTPPVEGGQVQRVHNVQAADADGHTVVIGSYEAYTEDNGLIEGGTTDRAAAFDPATGEVLWAVDVPGPLLPPDGPADDNADEASTSPWDGAEQTVVVAATSVAVGETATPDSVVAGFDAATGEQVWSHPGAFRPQWATADVVIGAADVGTEGHAPRQDLVALSRSTGTRAWTQASPDDVYGNEWRVHDVAGGTLAVGFIYWPEAAYWGGMHDQYRAVLVDVAGGQVRGTADQFGDLGPRPRVSPDGTAAYYVYDNQTVRQVRTDGGGWEIPVPEGKSPQISGWDADGNPLLELGVDYDRGTVTVDAATGQQIGDVVPLNTDSSDEEPEPYMTVGDWIVYLEPSGGEPTLRGERT